MERVNNDPTTEKLSRQFRARLSLLGPRAKVRAIVLLRTPVGGPASRADRHKFIDRIRTESEPAFKEIDATLKRYGGERLALVADALGSVPVETTVRGITALAASDYVKAILEDQAISALR